MAQEDENNPKILAVDDSDVICALLKFSLQQSGMQVETLKNLEEAQKAVQHNLYDLIIIDYMLSTTNNGLQLVEFLQTTDNARTPVIMLSAGVEEEYKQQAKQLGVKVWMKKPFSPQSISKLITQILSSVDNS